MPLASVDQTEERICRLKLSLVTETFPPEVNGVSMTLGRLVQGLGKRGVRVAVIAPRRKDRTAGSRPAGELLQVPGLPLPRYPELRFGFPAGDRLRTEWTRTRPDLVHVATEGPLGWSALRVAQHLEIPVVSSFHTNFHSYGSHYGFGFLRSLVLNWLRHCHNQTLRTFVPSTDLMERLEAEGFHNLRLFSRGVDVDLFGPHRRCQALREEWGAAKETPVALYVGRLAGEKNLDLTIRAYRQMKRHLPDLRLVLVGDGPERAKIRRACPEALLAGMQRGESLARHYASADCFLFASITETFGNVVTEAMASGLPVLAYDYAAPARFIRPGLNGMLVPYNDEAAFIDRAIVLARRREDWPAMGALARENLLPHSWDGIIDAYLREVCTLPSLQDALSA